MYKYKLNKFLGINRASIQGITLFRDKWTEFPEIKKTLELYEFVEREDKVKESEVPEVIKEQVPEVILTEKPKRGRKKKEVINA